MAQGLESMIHGLEHVPCYILAQVCSLCWIKHKLSKSSQQILPDQIPAGQLGDHSPVEIYNTVIEQVFNYTVDIWGSTQAACLAGALMLMLCALSFKSLSTFYAEWGCIESAKSLCLCFTIRWWRVCFDMVWEPRSTVKSKTGTKNQQHNENHGK